MENDPPAPALSLHPGWPRPPFLARALILEVVEPYLALSLRGSMMSRVGGSSGGRRQTRDGFGEETGLPLLMCPECNKARVIERRSQKQNENHGRVYFKCPRNISWVHDRCPYYKWQREYFDELVEKNVVQIVLGQAGEELIEEEVQSMDCESSWMAARAGGVVQYKAMEAKVDSLMKTVMFLTVLVVALVGVGVGYILK
ncbi:unnamed protein product [Urochloa humidicola]